RIAIFPASDTLRTAGVRVERSFANAIRGNLIYSRDPNALAIDLGPPGPTPNDAGDPDFGANDLQNSPDLYEATSDGAGTIISGNLSTSPLGTFALDFYSTPTCPAQGLGEARAYL